MDARTRGPQKNEALWLQPEPRWWRVASGSHRPHSESSVTNTAIIT